MNSELVHGIYKSLGSTARSQYDVESMILSNVQGQLEKIQMVLEKLDAIYQAICGGGINIAAIMEMARADDTDNILQLAAVAQAAAAGITSTAGLASVSGEVMSTVEEQIPDLGSIISESTQAVQTVASQAIAEASASLGIDTTAMLDAASSASGAAAMFAAPSAFANLDPWDRRNPEIHQRYAIQFKGRVNHKRTTAKNVIKQLYSIKDTFIYSMAYKAKKILTRGISDPIMVMNPRLLVDTAASGISKAAGGMVSNVLQRVDYDTKEMIRNVVGIQDQLVVIVRKPTLKNLLMLAGYFANLYDIYRSAVASASSAASQVGVRI